MRGAERERKIDTEIEIVTDRKIGRVRRGNERASGQDRGRKGEKK